MSQQELLKKVIQVLDQVGIQYMITGSVVSSLQGEPRSTHDIDMVIAIEKSVAKRLVEAFPPPDFYLDEGNIFDAIKRQSMFNLININTGDQIDFWILTDETFDQSRFLRKISEDTLLAKLRWAKLSGGSEKQFTDALRVYEVQYGKLDIDYLEQWAKKLNVESLWKQLVDEAETV